MFLFVGAALADAPRNGAPYSRANGADISAIESMIEIEHQLAIDRLVGETLARPPIVPRLEQDPATRPLRTVKPRAGNERPHAAGRGGDYSLKKIRAGSARVPLIIHERMPGDLADIEHSEIRKATFIKVLLPIVLAENNRIAARRERLIEIVSLLEAGGAPDGRDMEFLAATARQYAVDLSAPDLFEKLRRRVDIVPPSLALGQAALESAWGTSRFAQQGNALFGQRSWRKGSGLVPVAREAGRQHEVLAFGALADSVAFYMRNLNTHEAYGEYRRRRAALRSLGARPDGYYLAASLDPYSEKGLDYVEALAAVIRDNRLWHFDDAKLTRGQYWLEASGSF